ncbi:MULTISPECIES: hypothetical protein [Bacillus]|uniref:hypothetical protein n=1 Tax=Bacillus TaxID=1386 RepID=UPI0002EB708C|nr:MULTISPECIES: hypothetical protein [Bacillus]
MVEVLSNKHIYVDDTARMFLPVYKRDTLLRLSISQVKCSQMEEGIKQIADAIILLQKRTAYVWDKRSTI